MLKASSNLYILFVIDVCSIKLTFLAIVIDRLDLLHAYASIGGDSLWTDVMAHVVRGCPGSCDIKFPGVLSHPPPTPPTPPPNPGLSHYQLQVSNPPFRNITQLSLATVINHFTVTKTKGIFLLDCCKSVGLETSGLINFFLVQDILKIIEI